MDPANEMEYEELKEQLDKVIEGLPLKRKQVYKMSRLEGLSYKEIAQRNLITIKTVENHINLAQRYIRKQLSCKNENIIL